MLWAAAAPWIADALVVERPLDHSDAALVLSGAADYLQRARGAAKVYGDGVAPRVLLTDDDQRGGWDDTEKGNPYFVDRMVRELIRLGVPAEAIEKLPGKVHGTDDEAETFIRALNSLGVRSVTLVTSEFHSRRALWTFERAAARSGSPLVIGLRRAPSDQVYPNRYNWWLSVRGWRSVGLEYLKFGWYWLYY